MGDEDPEKGKDQGDPEDGKGKDDQEPKPKTLDEALAALDKLGKALKDANAEAAGRRKKLKEYEDADTRRQADEKKRHEADLSETEKLKAHAAELEEQLEQAAAEADRVRIRSAVETAAGRLGFQNPEDAYHLADLAGVEVDEAGRVKGVDEALKALVKARAYLLKRAGDGSGDIDATRKGKGDLAIDEKEEVEFKKRYGLR